MPRLTRWLARPTRLRLETLEPREVPAVLTVTSLADNTTAGDGFVTLREALQAANSDSTVDGVTGTGDDTIVFAPSLSGGTVILTGGELVLTDTDSTTIDGGGVITISGNDTSRVFYVDTKATATLAGLTVTDGDADDGGGVYNSGTLTIAGSTITGNTATYDGGGVFNHDGGTLTITNSTISGNTAESGGGVYNDNGTLTVDGSTISGNSADYYDGGGVYSFGTLTITNSTISGNSADYYGGGVYSDGTLTVSGSTISGNSATNNGGGVRVGGTLTVTNSTISGNTAGSDGGGVYNDHSTTTITNSTISRNTAISDGGGIYNYSGAVTIAQSTIAGNAASSEGGGIYNEDEVDMEGSLLLGNTAPTDADLADSYHFNDNGGNLIGVPSGYTLGQVVDVDGEGKPRLADHGGPTHTIALPAGSPAIKAGQGSGTVDQRGVTRTAPPDAGAFQLQTGVVTVTLGSGTYTGGPFIPTAVSVTDFESNTVATLGNTDLVYRYYAGTLTAGQIATATPLAGPPVNVGSYTLVTEYTAVGYRNTVSEPVHFTISPAVLSVTADAKGKTVGTADPAFTFRVSGLRGTDTAAVLTGALARTPGEAVGAYTIGIGSLAVGSNYSLTFTSATFTINPAPAPLPPPATPISVSTGRGVGGTVQLFNLTTGTPGQTFQPYPGFTGAILVTAGDVNGDGFADVITGVGPGGGPHVKVFDGATGAEIRSFFAYDPAFPGGVNVTTGDVNGDGFADIVTGVGTGGAAHVKVFSGKDGSELYSFFAYDPAFRGGVNVAAGDVNGDGFADIVTGAGVGGRSHVKAFSGKELTLLRSFFAYDPMFTGEVYVSAADFTGDGMAEIVTGAGAGGASHVKVFDGNAGSVLSSFFAYDPGLTSGVRVGVGRWGNGPAIVTGAGAGGAPHVKVFDLFGNVRQSFFAGDLSFIGGVFVG